MSVYYIFVFNILRLTVDRNSVQVLAKSCAEMTQKLRVIFFHHRKQILNRYRVRQSGCSLTHSARTPPAVHPGITIWVDENREKIIF